MNRDRPTPDHVGSTLGSTEVLHHTCDPSNCVRRGLAALGRRVLFLIHMGLWWKRAPRERLVR